MYKTVDFNIFERHLEELVYGKDSVSRRNEYRTAHKSAEYSVTTMGEIVVKPLNETAQNTQERSEK